MRISQPYCLLAMFPNLLLYPPLLLLYCIYTSTAPSTSSSQFSFFSVHLDISLFFFYIFSLSLQHIMYVQNICEYQSYLRRRDVGRKHVHVYYFTYVHTYILKEETIDEVDSHRTFAYFWTLWCFNSSHAYKMHLTHVYMYTKIV